ncbi:apolipophorins isoform X3 [Hemibagrus wyckioides]|uniref:apolipophorins isoform X3 n=1 Tax=Hemibagrus wyckioides TaxID=337641 RepID=UPI00266C8416|nr:apolipophorins isoform X3 [Hemibagrus wyckioides]
MSLSRLLMPWDLFILLLISIFPVGEGHKLQQGQLCKSTCSASWNMQKGQRHTYRYSTTITSSMKGPTSGGSQLAFDCVVDIDTLPGCPDMLLRLRNPQIKQSSPKKENSVLRLKNIREALEKKPLRFLLQGGKVTALCPQGTEQVWALNIKRAILSMLQTSHSGRVRETVKETDIYGTCISSYELKGTSLVKTRHLQQCLQDRVNDFWQNSVPLKDDRTVNANLKCTQHYGTTIMDRVNCTETVVLVPLSGSLDMAQTSTVSTLTLLRTLDGIQIDSGLHDEGYLTDLQFDMDAVKPSQRGSRLIQELSSTVRRICANSADQQQQSDLFLSLALQLRTLTLQQLSEVWQEVSFKCLDDWQPLLEALPSCGSEACIQFTTNLILNKEIGQDHITSFLSTVTFTSYPTSSMINHISSLLKLPPIRPKTLLAVSSLVHRFCQRERTPCSQIPAVQELVLVLKEDLRQSCGGQEPLPITELLHVLKAVENIGLPEFIPPLKICIHNHSAPEELRLAVVQAFRHIPCHRKRGVLAWTYQQLQEDVEIRIAAYQQLMSCPDQEVFRIVKDTLSNETSTQVGSFVWSHLFNILKTEDPLKKDLMESLPHDIISKDFEAEPWKYSSHMDITMDTGAAILNTEGALVFSPMSFLPRSAMANLTAYILGRSFNILEVSFRMENAESFLWSMFEGQHAATNKSPTDQTVSTSHGKKKQKRNESRLSSQQENANENEDCKSNILSPLKSKFTGKRKSHNEFQCWINVKMFGNDLTYMTCNEMLGKLRELSLSVAGFTVKLLKGQEVKLNHRAVVLAEDLVLPSLSGLPIKLNINMSSFYSLWVKGSANFKDWSQFSLAGYVKPKAFVDISARMGVDGGFGRVGLEWVTQFRTSTTLDGGIYVHNGQSLKMVLNTPDDVMEILSFSFRMYRISGESREELTPRNLKEKTTCSPKTWSKMLGWQLCTDVTYPVLLMGKSFPPPGPMIFSLRLQKLDRVLQKYLLEAAYSFVPKQNSWIPREANLLIFLGTPQSTIPRDISLDFNLNPQRLILKIVHPQKSILIQGQFDEVNGQRSGKAEILIDDKYHYYLKGLIETLNLPSEKRTQYQLEAKFAADGHPVILSANVTHGLNRKINVSAKLKNVFIKDAAFSVQVERRQDEGKRQYSLDAGLLLPYLLNTRILGLLENRGLEWTSGLRIRYGVQEDSENTQECHMSQNLRHEVKPAEKHYGMTVEHELQCSHMTFINHRIQMQHERSPIHIQSSLDLSYGNHWNQGSNKQRVLLNQSIRNQSGPSLTSYALEFSLRIPDKGLNCKTQFLYSHQKRRQSEMSTHLKVNYNDQIPLVAGLHWKDMSAKSSLRKWEGSLNMDTPWMYVYMAHKLSQLQHGTSQFTSEITTRKMITISNLMVDGLYRERGRDREGHLYIFTPTVTYMKVGGYIVAGKRRVNASCSISTAWMPTLRGEISLGNGKELKTLDMSTGYGKENLNISASLNTVDKKLKKRFLMMTITLSDLNNSYFELDIGGRVEEMRKDVNLYQKRWVLHFRQPYKFLPQSLHLQKTFTVDLHKGIYIFESKLLLSDNRKAIHVLTLGFRPQHFQPYVCSSLINSFNLENVPQDLEICISIYKNQTMQVLQGRMLIAKKEKVLVLGQVQLYDEGSQQGVVIKVNLTQLLQMKIPSLVTFDGEAMRSYRTSKDFKYIAKGNVAIDDKDYDAYLSLEKTPSGNISSSGYLRSDGKINAMLDVSLANAIRKNVHAVDLTLSFQQTLFPPVIAELHLHLSANSSSDSFFVLCALRKSDEVFQAQLNAALEQNPGLRLSLLGDLNVSLSGVSVLTHVSSLAGLLDQAKCLTEGYLTLTVDQAVYRVEMKHTKSRFKEETNGSESAWICVLAQEKSLCMNISRIFIEHEENALQAQLDHSFPLLLSAGIPFTTSCMVDVKQCKSGLSAELVLHAGAQELKLMLQRRLHNSTEIAGHLLVNCMGRIGLDHLLGYCYSEALDQSLRMEIQANLSDSIQILPENQGTLSLLLKILGHHLTPSTGLMVNVHHNISSLQPYVPFGFNTKSQLNRSSSSVKAAAELVIDDHGMRFKGQASQTKLGFKQVFELYHSLPQLMTVPSSLLVKTWYAGRNGSHVLTHQTQWMDENSPAPTGLQQWKSRQIDEFGPQTRGWGLEVRFENDTQSKRGNVVIEWDLTGAQEQIQATGSWNSAGTQSEAVLELKQPFTPALPYVHLQVLSHDHEQGHGRNNQLHLSWDHGTPVNVSVTVNNQSHKDFSMMQACVFVSPGQMRSVLPLVEAHGCASMAQEGKFSFSQNAELKWGDKKMIQSMKYQKTDRGMHTVQMETSAQNISPGPCSSHTLRAQIHSNLKDLLEHHVLLGLCPPQPALSWSGSHRVNSGKDLLYSHTSVSLSDQTQNNAFVLALRNTSSAQRSHYSLLTEWKMGNWSIELGGNVHTTSRNSALQVQAKLDRNELVWLQTMLGKRCLQAAAGYDGDSSDDLRMTLCLEGNHWLTFKTQRGGSGMENETLALISMGAVDRGLVFRAKGCEACLAATEARLQQLGTHMKKKLLQRVQRLHHLLLDFRRQAGGNEPVQELSQSILHMMRRAENLLLQRGSLPWDLWMSGSVRHAFTHSLPRTLQILQHMSQLVQQELRKPLATLAGAYHDVTGERLDVMWHGLLDMWGRVLEQMLPAVLHNHHLRTPSITALRTAITAVDLVMQHTVQWAESRLAMMLVGFRRQLAFMYKFSEREGEMTVSLPVPRNPWTKRSVVSIAEVIVEEFLMKPLLSLNSASITAELYRLKRKLMDSPFNHQAFLVADGFIVSFDGQVLKIPDSCDLVLAADVTTNAFVITLKSDQKEKQHSLMVQLQNTTIIVRPKGQMEVDCRSIHTPFTNSDVTVTRELNLLTVSNRKGLLVTCDPSLSTCSVTLDGWLHGISRGLLGTNDNEVGNDYLLPNGSQAHSMDEFTQGWNMGSNCVSVESESCTNRMAANLSCSLFFSSTMSPLSSCFRVVDPKQFLMMCERSQCDALDATRTSVCKLALAYVQLCHRNYIPLELPIQCA